METYYGRNKTTAYTLEKELSHGGEGTVYSIFGKSNYVAKIYKSGRITSASAREEMRLKIEAMLDMHFSPNVENKLIVAWPIDLLYDKNGVFCGFIMPRVVGKKSLIWATRETDRNILFENQYNWKKSVAIAYNLSMVVEILHGAGIVIGDMNPNNILIDKTGNVTLIDADSFNISAKTGRVFKCTVGMEEVLPAELQGRDLSDSTSRFSEKTDCFSLAIHIFNLLCNNCHPFGCLNFNSPKGSSAKSPRIQNIVEGYCPYVTGGSGTPVETAPDMRMLSSEIRSLFDRAFSYSVTTAVKSSTINNRPSAREWRQALLSLYKSTMTTCRVNAQHIYPSIYSLGCPWCDIEKRRTAPKPPIPPPKPQPPKPQPPKPPIKPVKKHGMLRFLIAIAFIFLLLWLSDTNTRNTNINSATIGNNNIYINTGKVTRVRFTAPSSGTYVFATNSTSDTVGYLYSSSTSTSAIKENDDWNNDNDFHIEHTMTANQTVYVGVKYFNSANSGSVSLNISRKTTTSTQSSTTSAPSIATVRTGQNTVAIRRGQVTRVKFTASSSGTYVFTTNSTSDTVGYLYSSSTSTSAIKENDDWNNDNDFHIEHTMTANQTVYVGVKYFDSNRSGSVTLNISKKTTSTTSSSNARWPVGETCRVTSASANVRSGPGVGYSDVGDVFNGSTYEILESRLGDTGKDWYKIRHNGQYCWLSSGVVSVNGYSQGTINGEPIR